jgi:hypothetical protein
MRTVLAAALFVAAVVVVLLGGLLAVGLVGEYGPAEGYGDLAVQVLPVVAGSLGVGALLAWAGRALLRSRRDASAAVR